MEYPFKDLLPLDEVLDREGYYKDWTHLDPEVFYSLTQISNFIKTKGYGVDVRLLIAQLAEHFGLKTTQVVDLGNLLTAKHATLKTQVEQAVSQVNADRNALETQFNQSVAQMETEKDAVIANATVDSEVILARGDKPTLQARLDETTEQLDQIAYNVKSFGAVGDGIADDTLAIQEAFDYVDNAGGGIVYFPKGTYIFSNLLQVGDYTTVRGSGIGSSILKMKDNLDFSTLNAYKEISLSTKKGKVLNYVAFEDIEIDGNSQNNRHWAGKHYSQLSGSDFALTLANGISFDTFDGRTPPKTIVINKVKVHNTIRNCVLGQSNENIFISDSIFGNSDADHILYVQNQNNKGRALLNNVTVYGYARDSLVQASGCIVNNINFVNLTENPTGYKSYNLFLTMRENTNSNVYYDGYNEVNGFHAYLDKVINHDTNLTVIFFNKGFTSVNGVEVRFSKDFPTDHEVYFSQCAGNSSEDNAAGGASMAKINCNNVPDRFRLSMSSANVIEEGISFDDVSVNYLNKNIATVGDVEKYNSQLIQFAPTAPSVINYGKVYFNNIKTSEGLARFIYFTPELAHDYDSFTVANSRIRNYNTDLTNLTSAPEKVKFINVVVDSFRTQMTNALYERIEFRQCRSALNNKLTENKGKATMTSGTLNIPHNILMAPNNVQVTNITNGQQVSCTITATELQLTLQDAYSEDLTIMWQASI